MKKYDNVRHDLTDTQHTFLSNARVMPRFVYVMFCEASFQTMFSNFVISSPVIVLSYLDNTNGEPQVVKPTGKVESETITRR